MREKSQRSAPSKLEFQPPLLSHNHLREISDCSKYHLIFPIDTTQASIMSSEKADKKDRKKDKKEKKSKTADDGVKKEKKEKKSKKSKGVTDALAEKLEEPYAATAGADDEMEGIEVVRNVPASALVPFANPLADEKQTKKVLKAVKKGKIRIPAARSGDAAFSIS